MLNDCIFGLRLLLKDRAFTAPALLTLALCIGANSAVFSVLLNVVLRGLPFPHPGELVTMYNVYPGVGVLRGSNGVPDYLDRRKMKDVFSEVALIGGASYEVGMEGSPRRIRGQNVTPSFFRVLGMKPLIGRTFTENEAVLGKEKVAVLSEGLWKELYSSDPNLAGKDIRLSGTPYRIVGVMPASFGIYGDDVRIYTSFAFTRQQTSDQARHNNSWAMIARLKPGVRIARAQERIDNLNRRNLDIFPQFRQLLINARFGTKVVGLNDDLVHEFRPTLQLLQIAVGALLLIGCVNLANLMLVRSNIRIREFAIRHSLGATRWRIARQLLAESVVLALMGGALGAAVAYGGVRLLAWLGAGDLPRGSTVGIDSGVLLFTAAIAFAAGIGFGSLPLFHVLRRDLNAVFRGSERGGTAGRGAAWIRSALVASQFALAFVLLVGASLLTVTFVRLLRVDPGFKPENVLTAQITLPQVRYEDDARARNFLAGLMQRLSVIPGVRHAGATTLLPFGGNNNSSVIMFVGRPLGPGENPPVPAWNVATPGYLHAMGIPVLEGRDISDSDGPGSQKVVIIDQFLARRYFPNGGALGTRITRGVQVPGEPRIPDECTIVGVAGSVRTGDLAGSNPVGQVYFSYRQFVPRNVHLALNTRPGNPQLIAAIRNSLKEADPELPLFDIKTMPERLSDSLRIQRAAMMLCLIFAFLALLLAAIGVYGVLAYSVSQRTREFGIRTALGARQREVVGLVVCEGLRMASIGLIAGAAAAFVLSRLMTSLLFGVRPTDPVVFLAATLILGAVASLASLIPSFRAARTPPAVALRYE
jgi:predicted permease